MAPVEVQLLGRLLGVGVQLLPAVLLEQVLEPVQLPGVPQPVGHRPCRTRRC